MTCFVYHVCTGHQTDLPFLTRCPFFISKGTALKEGQTHNPESHTQSDKPGITLSGESGKQPCFPIHLKHN